jgi:hypothetical protein
MTADLYDAIIALLHVTTMANAKNPKKVPEPKPYPRPDEGDKPKPIDPLLAKLRGGKPNVKEARPDLIPLPPS